MLVRHLEEMAKMLADLLRVGLQPHAPHRGHKSIGQARLYIVNGGGAWNDLGFKVGPMG
jgi:hypothetical protein